MNDSKRNDKRRMPFLLPACLATSALLGGCGAEGDDTTPFETEGDESPAVELSGAALSKRAPGLNSLILWQDDRGRPTVQVMQGNKEVGVTQIYDGPLVDWDLMGGGDVDNDGHGDLLWRSKGAGAVTFWLLKGATIAATPPGIGFAPRLANGSFAKHVLADVNQDGRTDIVFLGDRLPAPKNSLCKDAFGSPVAPFWHERWIFQPNHTVAIERRFHCGAPLAVGQFDGTGDLDILVYRNASISDWSTEFQMASGVKVRGPWLRDGWRLGGVGDITRDGISDLIWHNQTDAGTVQAWVPSAGGGLRNVSLPPVPPGGWQIIGLGDFTADGIPDVAWREPNLGLETVWIMNEEVKLVNTPFAISMGKLMRPVGTMGSDRTWGHTGITVFRAVPGGTATCSPINVTVTGNGLSQTLGGFDFGPYNSNGRLVCDGFFHFNAPEGTYTLTTSAGARQTFSVMPLGTAQIEICGAPGQCTNMAQTKTFTDNPAALLRFGNPSTGPVNGGPIWYLGSFPAAGSASGTITTIRPQLLTLDFPFGQNSANCSDASKIVRLAQGQAMSPSQMQSVFGATTIRFPRAIGACLAPGQVSGNTPPSSVGIAVSGTLD